MSGCWQQINRRSVCAHVRVMCVRSHHVGASCLEMSRCIYASNRTLNKFTYLVVEFDEDHFVTAITLAIAITIAILWFRRSFLCSQYAGATRIWHRYVDVPRYRYVWMCLDMCGCASMFKYVWLHKERTSEYDAVGHKHE